MTPEEALAKQAAYEKYRRARGILTSFYQAMYGIQNVSAYTKPTLWPNEDVHKCTEILGRCRVILQNLQQLEYKVRDLTDKVPIEHDVKIEDIKE